MTLAESRIRGSNASKRISPCNEIRAGDEPHHDVECVTQQLREHVNEATEDDDGGLHHHLHQCSSTAMPNESFNKGQDLSKDSCTKVVSSDAPSTTEPPLVTMELQKERGNPLRNQTAP